MISVRYSLHSLVLIHTYRTTTLHESSNTYKSSCQASKNFPFFDFQSITLHEDYWFCQLQCKSTYMARVAGAVTVLHLYDDLADHQGDILARTQGHGTLEGTRDTSGGWRSSPAESSWQPILILHPPPHDPYILTLLALQPPHTRTYSVRKSKHTFKHDNCGSV